jgi:prepilin-type N-terminal cleavage/methylation domain-containing protein
MSEHFPHPHPRTARRAFSLVEISIVITVIGLFSGAIMVGKSIMRATSLQSITTERAAFESAFNQFAQQYGELPGDMSQAHAMWSTAGCKGLGGLPTAGGCNGNGDRILMYNQHGENLKAWLHMELAGLIAGNYSGSGTVDSGQAIILEPENSPTSRFAKGTWFIGGTQINQTTVTPSLLLGRIDDSTIPIAGDNKIFSLTREEAESIDKKYDDGLARSGRMKCSLCAAGASDTLYATDRTKGQNPDEKGVLLEFNLQLESAQN